ncbi:hypothetical protein MHEL_00640 [Mycolicibacterium helvum]|uniref:Uncharacterized protein n=1 Tax=Mycolicibacterium helvum TaxID=1534349 RepID=A0A7I7SZU7_9MYCO|nr:hypothetical protein MHEL_00640 [Mycolicibacterium helvum]
MVAQTPRWGDPYAVKFFREHEVDLVEGTTPTMLVTPGAAPDQVIVYHKWGYLKCVVDYSTCGADPVCIKTGPTHRHLLGGQ